MEESRVAHHSHCYRTVGQLSGRSQEKRYKHGLKLLLLVMTSYTSLALFLGYYHDYWVYPYLRDMNHFMRLGFMVVHLAIPTLYYYVGGILYDLSWSNRHCANDCPINITIDSICSQMKKASNIMK